MKRDFTNENFEHFLKRSADNLRMRAPDKVWQNLSRELNKRRRRFIIGFTSLVLLTSAIGYHTLTHISKENELAIQNTQHQTINRKIAAIPNADLAIVENRQGGLNKSINSQSTAHKNSGHNRNSFRAAERTFLSLSNVYTEPEDKNPVIDNFTPTIVDSYTEFDNAQSTTKAIKLDNASASADLPFTIESVTNAYKAKTKKGKFESQFYFSPTISYRKLTENKSYLRTLDPAAVPANYPALYSSVNSNVTHKPDVGFELGFAVKYPVSNRLKIRSGLQFNVNRYDIKAFNSPSSIATIALNNGFRVDSLNTISSYSNINGYKSDWLQNLSFQVSAPVGVEYVFGQTNKVQIGMATTIQPTYVLGDRAYLITTDYKSYTQVPWLIRHWNVNTAFETFVVYNSGKTRWQVGPQVRYQLLSSFISKYPVKENLFDFGLKVGISLNN